MNFKEFAQLLYGIIGSQQKVGPFVRTLFEHIVTDTGLDAIADLTDDRARHYYSGNNGISRIARDIVEKIEPALFERYIDDLPDASVQMLADSFVAYIPDITPHNASEKLAEQFVAIIKNAAGTTRKAKTENATITTEKLPKTIHDYLKLYANPFDFDETADIYEEYLTRATEYYSEVKTLLYAETPRNFRDFYVCNDLITHWEMNTISNVTIGALRGVFPRILISGTGGIGKTMMMRHLLFDCVETYQEAGTIPILVLLRNYKESDTNLADLLYETVCEFTDHIPREAFEEKLSNGNCVILLDGLDETVGQTRKVLHEALNNFVKKYQNNLIVMTSRPTTLFAQIDHFATLTIKPFDKTQALALIDKLDFHDKEVQKAFKADLDEKLYDSHRQFASNPLLLTIMLMTYDSYGNVPAKRHIFYAKAYEVMARLHDTTKGTYVRPMHTNLEPDEFAEYFSKFCFITYKDGILEFTEKEFCKYMDQVLAHNKTNIQATSKAFLKDLTDNLCILYREGQRYYFIHRSFQEYFCALSCTNLRDEKLLNIGTFFETQKNRIIGDYTFGMLYDMIPEKIERYVFLPHLQKIWNRCSSAHGYRSFLWYQYRELHINQGTVGQYYENEPKSFLYNFIINEHGFRKNGQLDDLPWPDGIESFKRINWINDGKNAIVYTDWEEYVWETGYYEHYDESLAPKICGASYLIGIEHLYDYPDEFANVIAFIESDNFPLKQEYLQVGTYIKQLEDRFNKQEDSENWLDWF